MIQPQMHYLTLKSSDKYPDSLDLFSDDPYINGYTLLCSFVSRDFATLMKYAIIPTIKTQTESHERIVIDSSINPLYSKLDSKNNYFKAFIDYVQQAKDSANHNLNDVVEFSYTTYSVSVVISEGSLILMLQYDPLNKTIIFSSFRREGENSLDHNFYFYNTYRLIGELSNFADRNLDLFIAVNEVDLNKRQSEKQADKNRKMFYVVNEDGAHRNPVVDLKGA